MSGSHAGMQVRGHDDRPALVCGIDKPAESLAGGLPGGQHADVVVRDEVAPGDLGDGFGGGAVDGDAAERQPSCRPLSWHRGIPVGRPAGRVQSQENPATTWSRKQVVLE